MVHDTKIVTNSGIIRDYDGKFMTNLLKTLGVNMAQNCIVRDSFNDYNPMVVLKEPYSLFRIISFLQLILSFVTLFINVVLIIKKLKRINKVKDSKSKTGAKNFARQILFVLATDLIQNCVRIGVFLDPIGLLGEQYYLPARIMYTSISQFSLVLKFAVFAGKVI